MSRGMSNTPTTTQKERSFLGEPMGTKPATAIPGIGPARGARLADAGYSKASQVYGQYLVNDRGNAAFEGWMKNTSGANSKQAGDSYKALDTYYRQFN